MGKGSEPWVCGRVRARVRVIERLTSMSFLAFYYYYYYYYYYYFTSMSSLALFITLVKRTFMSRCCASILLAFISAWRVGHMARVRGVRLAHAGW